MGFPITLIWEKPSDVIDRQELVVSEPEPMVAVGAHKDSAVEIIARLWCKKENYWPLYFAMQEQVKEAFDREGIEIPFPQLDVHMPEKDGSR